MPSAISVAKEFVRLSYSGSEADPLTNLRLQKLLYYAQAWSLVIRESQLFPEIIEAWKLGPVVRDTYEHVGRIQSQPICLETFQTVPDVAEDVATFVIATWDAYKKYSPSALRNKTHRERPYLKAWGDRPDDGTGRGNEEIRIDDLEDYFSKQSIPAPLAAYEHRRRKAEERAADELSRIPQFEIADLTRMITHRSHVAHEQFLAQG